MALGDYIHISGTTWHTGAQSNAPHKIEDALAGTTDDTVLVAATETIEHDDFYTPQGFIAAFRRDITALLHLRK